MGNMDIVQKHRKTPWGRWDTEKKTVESKKYKWHENILEALGRMGDPRRGKGRERGRGRGSVREERPKQSMHKNDIRNMLLIMLILNLRY